MRKLFATAAHREQGWRQARETGRRAEQPDEHLVSLLAPRSFEAEQYRVLGHVIGQMHKDADLRVIAVTSPAVGDGKTTTAINLAGTLAQGAHTRVLLIDGDLRRPSVGVQFRLLDPDAPGLVDAILKPDVGVADVVQRFPQFNLSIVAAGRCEENPYEVLKSEPLAEVLREARAAYDYVVIDTPPLVPLPDCRAIAKWVDGFAMIVAAHKTPQRLLEEALGIIEPSKLLGIVFNRNDRPMSDSYGYYGAYLQPMNGHRAPWWWRGRRGRAA